jgi:hypothetical protein
MFRMPQSAGGKKGRDMASGRNRIIVSSLVSLAVLLTPLLLALLGRFSGTGAMATAAGVVTGLTVVVCPMIFELLSRDTPEWGYGLGFSVVSSLVICATLTGVLWHASGDLELSSAGAGTVVGFVFGTFVICFVFGMAGASVASLIGRALPAGSEYRPATRIRPWHVGAAVAIAELAVAVVVAAALG